MRACVCVRVHTHLPQQRLRYIESERVRLVLQDQPHLLLFDLKLGPLRLLQLLEHFCERLECGLARNGVTVENPRARIMRRALDLVLVIVVTDLEKGYEPREAISVLNMENACAWTLARKCAATRAWTQRAQTTSWTICL